MSSIPDITTPEAVALEAQPIPIKAERADKARNRARILAAASLCFAESGIDAQMDEIAARAGVGVGTLYRHFATKEALMGAMMRRKFEQILAVTTEQLERDGEPFERLKVALRGGADVAAADAAAQDALMRAGGDVWEHAGDVLEKLLATMQRLIDLAQAAGTLRADVSAADVPMLMCGVSATMATAEWDWHRHLEILIDGLAARPGQTASDSSLSVAGRARVGSA